LSDVTNIQGIDIEQVLTKLATVASKRDAYEIVGAFLSDAAFGTHRRPFDYYTSFPKDDPQCDPKFARSFVHADWRDGQDLVQAEQTAGEDGFNLRFHRIEQDLDALADDVHTAFHCLAEMRSALADLLGELRTVIRIVQADIARLEQRAGGDGGVIATPPITKGKLLGSVQWFDRNMLAFETPQGITLFPRVGAVEGGNVADPRINRVGALGTLLQSSRRIKNNFGAPMKTVDLVKSFGKLEVDGYTFEELVDILPRDATYASPEALLEAVAEREAAAIRTSGRADEVIAALGGSDGAASAADARLEMFEAVPSEVRTTLAAAGVDTVGELSTRSPKDVAGVLRKVGMKATVSDAAGWIAGARTFSLIR
jgi:hypothetical protein